MSTLKVRGEANCDFTADLFNISFKIRASQNSSGEAIEFGKKRTEQFLQTMKTDLGLAPDDFVMGDFSVRQDYGAERYIYEKSVSARIKADLKAVEKIAFLMEAMTDIEYTIDFELSDKAEKEKSVINSAIADSRSKAEMIAASLGKKIVGAEDVNYEYSSGMCTFGSERAAAKFINADSFNDLASQLKAPVKSIRKEINIIWKAE